MQTLLSAEFAEDPQGIEAERILRKCVHCGFCNATCPTYQLIGDELDGPRGRIYQMKLVLEGAIPTKKMQQHLDRCLTCRSCESTCPSGVQYGKLLEIGREIVDERVPRRTKDKLLRKLLTVIVPNGEIFSLLLKVGQLFRSILPISVREKIPFERGQGAVAFQGTDHPRKMVMLAGCAQPALAPNTNVIAKKLLDKMGITLAEVSEAGCCGAVYLHTSEPKNGRQAARKLIDAWHPYLQQGVEAFVMTASGCGSTIKEYAHLLKDDPAYFKKAMVISEKTFDLCEIVEKEMVAGYKVASLGQAKRVAFHPPCTLQHGQKISGKIESILRSSGYELTVVKDPHLCCGSAGTYSLLQPEIASKLRKNKQSALIESNPHVICTANVGCQSWLQTGSNLSVVYWAELLV
ncbi:MAG: glycolate oxidase subunit GlcF [Gammaproteobacteria bacterium]|nr:glycolate oxidase subunit GlcF [Gammaproteobacteria bacterium]